MNTIHTYASGPLALDVPVTRAVGRVEWVEIHSRLYGVDSVGNVFVFKPPYTTPRHRSLRRRGHFFLCRIGLYRVRARRAL